MSGQVKLERKQKPVNVWALALGSIIGWGAFVMPGTTFLPNAGTLGTAIGMAIASVIMIIIAMNYGYMVQKYPVAGGEYTFTEKTFGKKAAYCCGWFLGLSYLCIVPLNATALGLVSRKLLGDFLEVGYLYTVAGWDIYLGEIALASAALIIVGIMSIRGISVAGWAQTVLALALVASVVIIVIAAFVSPHTSVENLQPLYPDDRAPIAAIVAVVAIAPWAFVGFDSIPQAAEEFNFSTKKVSVIMILSILFGGAVYIALNTVTASVMPWEQMLAANYDWPAGEAVEIIMGKAGLMFLGVALICAVLSGIVGFYMATSRLLLSMAREQVLPAWFGKLNAKYKTPANAIIFIMAISLIAPWFGREVLVWIVDMSSIGAAIGYGCTCLAAFVTLKRNPQDHRPGLKVLSVIGAVCGLVFVGLLVIPGMPSYLAFESRIALLAWIILGIIFYITSSGRIKRWRILNKSQRMKHSLAVIEDVENDRYIDRLRSGNTHFARAEDKPLTPEQYNEIKAFWSKYEFAYDVEPSMVEANMNRSGIFDPRYIPYDLKDMIREAMVDPRYASLQGKTFLPKQLTTAKLPETVIAMWNGVFYDGRYNVITDEEAFRILMDQDEELVYKPTKETSGGKGIYFLKAPDYDELQRTIDKMRGGMIVQKAVKQHPEINAFNDTTVNTVRVTSYKRKNNEVVILATLMKVGGKGVRVDNYKQGGCVVGIDYETGKFNDWALATDYSRITVLPSGVDLKEKERFVPGFEKLKKTIRDTHLSLPQINLVSWDIAIDEESDPVVIEVNFGGDLRMHQIVTGPVFREYTEEILDEVLLKKYYKKDSIKHYDIEEYNDYIVISEYFGVQRKVKIPAEVHGKPVRKIRASAFRGNSYVRSVQVPDSVTHIGKGAFAYCRQLESFELCGELTVCGRNLFDGCTCLSKIKASSKMRKKYPKTFKVNN